MSLGRLPIRMAGTIILFFSILLFLSGYYLQQKSLRALSAAIAPPHPPTTTLHKKRPPPTPADDQTAHYLSLARPKTVACLQTVTHHSDLCNALMLFADLHRLGSIVPRVLHYPKTWDDTPTLGRTWKRLLRAAELRYSVILTPVDTPSSTLVAAFNETRYRRVLWLDRVGRLLRNPDALLLGAVPGAVVAGPRDGAGGGGVSRRFWMVETSAEEAARAAEQGEEQYEPYALVLPQRPYLLQVAEFRKETHEAYMQPGRMWNPSEALEEAWYVDFRDEEVPMPWTSIGGEVVERVGPRVERDRAVWWGLYRRWERMRGEVCGLDLEPAERKRTA